MPALFRIVQDDCPPIPEGASPIVKDFLYHCFQKDCNLRVSAKKLLKHPWMVAARKQMAGNQAARSSSTNGAESSKNGENVEKRPTSNYNYDEAVLKVQEWNEALKCMHPILATLSSFGLLTCGADPIQRPQGLQNTPNDGRIQMRIGDLHRLCNLWISGSRLFPRLLDHNQLLYLDRRGNLLRSPPKLLSPLLCWGIFEK